MLRFARLITGSASPTITLFHNTNSKLSHHLLERLTIHKSRFLLDVRQNRLPLYETYSFIHQECMNVHPQNNRSFERIFPALLASPSHLFCNVEVKTKSKLKQFVPDLELVNESSYLDNIALHNATELSPFVVDWANKLVAVDDEGLDTIMQNYYSCGMQKSSKVHLPEGSDSIHQGPDSGNSPIFNSPKISLQETCGPQYNQSAAAAAAAATAARCVVHPHIAEFADLY
ncbi:hypothetical protein METBIDRAFT_40791 [Metschnikowia bicuspidata var. bicuspidata NRRL YB-4993]|uniref:Uncharacterized protein n=1 Tax=Metschnikowia bicuspidata var. bicuspidata NRRL YB-4993 TaxID=869754 RepID=A0A1A0HBC2_9ASCO|nr:hypothetical protein METBIDRAFT_40791 [Metschnikowia bicuspidata var. bicuspidata NRRL YB-4993]OBA21172.1 hypothetical protein METBIDRAFT_40791 [Metschnikowia bicuspidata var. bicuspidata NRRL YB-4993]